MRQEKIFDYSAGSISEVTISSWLDEIKPSFHKIIPLDYGRILVIALIPDYGLKAGKAKEDEG